MNDVTWDILALLVTALGAVGTWWAFTRRGTLSGMRALGWTLLVPAAWLTGVFTLVGRITTAVGRWTSGIILSFSFWLGLGLGATALALILVTALLRKRGIERGTAGAVPTSLPPEARGSVRAPRASQTSGPAKGPANDGLDDIEELLRRRGIE